MSSAKRSSPCSPGADHHCFAAAKLSRIEEGTTLLPSRREVSSGHSFCKGSGYQPSGGTGYLDSEAPSSGPTTSRQPAWTSSKNSLSVYSCHSTTLPATKVCRVNPLLRHLRPLQTPLVENHSVQMV